MIDSFTAAPSACIRTLSRGEKPQGRAMHPTFLKHLLPPVLCQPSGFIWDIVAKENYVVEPNKIAEESNDYLRANSTAEEGTSGRDGGAEGPSVDTERLCRFCYGEEEEDAPTHTKGNIVGSGKLVSPCGCVGTQEFVHLSCLREWQRVARLEGQMHKASRCDVCKQPFTSQLVPLRLPDRVRLTG
eukprot:CAMPEP_0118934592 /NCGR_PEP_ID=MMETSP1169-20130426/13908_1 /TAXON_ID=36882 /ORGANISM="Pyramimonas obovata, Strain CCMP722" /LENGTH=185 /DNA_ID=CAMNT_0006877513 /DNA_START=61 /DNA_END=615 /DNA_ORIENTATION=+